MSDIVTMAYGAALGFLERSGPRPIHRVAANAADHASIADGSALLAHLRDAGPDDPLRRQFALALAMWDRLQTDAGWTRGAKHNTPQRRAAILDSLDLDTSTQQLVNELFPIEMTDDITVIAEDWEPWRTEERRHERAFYWPHYRRYLLETRRWPAKAVDSVDDATERVMQGLSDPTRPEAFGSRGLVIGYVQSGKTANFTGVLAKAIDSGYRLLIVLTGTTNMLRAQTQRRVDMELNGRESLEREISTQAIDEHDYHDDPEWIADRFLRHGMRPSDAGYPDIHRLSTHRQDFKRLGSGIAALDFDRIDRSRPFYHPANLFPSSARIIVTKKNKTVLENLVKDLGKIQANLADIPALIIDDESDQASINTINPKTWQQDRVERTAINRLIAQLLGMLPRAQYVGYTATPYANVFIDPADVENIFPRNFLISLGRPKGYMGADDFHDFESEVPRPQRTPADSNEKAHVRFLDEEPQQDELRQAVDMFVLTGAMKLHRQRTGHGAYTHHTMLVHEAMHRTKHRDTAELIKEIWDTAAYYQASGMSRLRKLYEEDILPVSRANAADMPSPPFDELRTDIGAALTKINPADSGVYPIIVVNTDSDLAKNQEALDFDKRPVWRILVGGNKLARGFTVEGLTISYYRRSTSQVDTLLQMGRWFGFRPGYRDLVRLFITEDLHEKFAAACQDEEFLRQQLRQYAVLLPDGRPQITPRQVPPLIAQHRPDLKPTQTNKMWNAQLMERRSPGKALEVTGYPEDAKATRWNCEKWEPVLAVATETMTFQGESLGRRDPDTNLRSAATIRPYDANVAVVSHEGMIDILGQLKWGQRGQFEPDLNWLRSLSNQVDQWTVLIPTTGGQHSHRAILGHGPFGIVVRKRTATGAISAISEHRHRNAVLRLSGVDTSVPDPVADSMRSGRMGALLLYPTVARRELLDASPASGIDPGVVTLAFHLVGPSSAVPGDRSLLKYQVRDSSQPTATVVDRPA